MSEIKKHSRTSVAADRASQHCIMPGCGASFGIHERIYVCAQCGGPLEIEAGWEQPRTASELRKQWESRATALTGRDRSGVWRYRELLPFEDDAPVVTLFEGNTPLYGAPRCAEYSGLRALSLKHQGSNPTGSFKDTGMTVAVTQALVLGAKTVVCASTGNTSASLAAYAARAGLQCAIVLPQKQISAAKLAQAMDYGAAIFEIDGNFDHAMRLVQELAEEDSIYLVNSINPFRIEGQKTVAFELMQQCGWTVPDNVVVPGGNLGNSSALGKGFEELRRVGLIDRLPKLHIAQAEGAAPLAREFARLQTKSKNNRGGAASDPVLPDKIEFVAHPRTLASAIKIGAPISWRKALRAVLRSGGQVLTVSEQEIADAKAMIGRDGVGCEPASATTVAAIRKLTVSGQINRDESVVAVLTGHILKDTDYVSHYHRGTLSIEADGGEKQPIAASFRNVPVSVPAAKQSILENLRRRRE
ncbi:MAG: threonine synthase [Candidatus Acidiferrales bacterium]